MRTAATIIAMTLSAICQAAPTLQWDYPPDVGQDGFRVYCGATPITGTPTSVEVVPTEIDLAGIVTAGTEYECWVAAYRGVEESPPSDHLVFTVPTEQTIILPSAPSGIRITW